MFVYTDWWIIFLFKTVDSFLKSGSLTSWILVPFYFIAKLESFWKIVLCKALFCITGFSDHKIHIKKSMAVLLNVMFMCVCIQC